MGNTSSHPGGTPDSVPPGMAAMLGTPSRDGEGRERRERRDRRDRERDVPVSPPSPPPPPTPMLLPYAGHLSPQNPHCLSHPQAHDYSKTAVTGLILAGQLAPFYRGLDDYEPDWTEEDIKRELGAARDKDFAEDVQNSFTQRLKAEREGARAPPSAEEVEERERKEAKAYLGAVECPICFLNYPPNINTSRCCQQPLCTECFVQIKRGEATSTHLESESACCPYCVESDFGVIYERPQASTATTPLNLETTAQHALATSPPDAGTSGFSAAVSLSEEAGSGAGTPNSATAKPVPRRKSVSSKAKEVVTIDQIRPDWEAKLNAVKAQAERRAARRIVMRQVGDRLIPIGYTSSRATGQADFSMSLPPIPVEEGRRSRRTRDREREMEEMMIMEAMRLSMIDHEEHQRKMADEDKNKANGKQAAVGDAAAAGNAPSTAGTSQPGPSQGATPTSSRRSSAAAATQGSWPAAQASSDSNGRGQGAASKLLSKITVGNRSRANSKSSVHFAPSPATVGSSPSGSNPGSNPPTLAATAANSADSVQTLSRNCSSSTPSPNPVQQAAHTHSPLAQDSSSHAANGFSTTAAVALPATTVTGPTDVEAPLIDLTPPARNAPLPKEPTAANPYPELAALMAEAVGDDSQPAASASASASATLAPSAASSAKTTSAPLAIPSQNASTSDLISVSSLASTPPGVHDPRPEVPLSAMADDDDY